VSRREAAETALVQVARRVLAADVHPRVGRVTLSLGQDGQRPQVDASVPLDGRDEPGAMALAMDAGVVQLRSLPGVDAGRGVVSGIVPVDDVPAPAAVDVVVEVAYGPAFRQIPGPRSADHEDLWGDWPDDCPHDAVVERRLQDGASR
jgi:hypothetical protein